jgi:hypothetical protein
MADSTQRKDKTCSLMQDKAQVIVKDKCFGMGIDKHTVKDCYPHSILRIYRKLLPRSWASRKK